MNKIKIISIFKRSFNFIIKNIKKLISLIKQYWPRFIEILKYIFEFIKKFWKKYNEEKISGQSATLTFVTLLGFIPFIIFILFFLPELSFLKLETHFKEAIIANFVPSSAEQIYEYIAQIAKQKIQFNLFSFIVLLITSYSLFKVINDTFDNILNAHEFKKTNIFFSLIKFFGMTIFGSLLILILLSVTSLPIVSKFLNVSFMQALALYITPLVLLFIIFTIGFYYIPSIKVRNRSVVIGAAISSLIWIVFKSIFNWYIINFTNTQLIFGVLASIPVFLFWIYANWIIILSGVIIVAILENRYLKPSNIEEARQTVKISFERILKSGITEEITSNTLKTKEIKQILSEILDTSANSSDEKNNKRNSLEKKKIFTD